jgi:hypothetical protein
MACCLHIPEAASSEVLYEASIVFPVDFLPVDFDCNVAEDLVDRRGKPLPISTVILEVFVALRFGAAHVCKLAFTRFTKTVP